MRPPSRCNVCRPAEIAVWLAPDQPAELIADDAALFPLIAIDFPKFNDGRGYSAAYLLRSRYRYTGELRAIGDVLRDQLFYMQRGFNAFATRADRNIQDAERSDRLFRSLSGIGGSATAIVPPHGTSGGERMSTLSEKVAHTSALLQKIADTYQPAALASSLAAEDMVLTDLILRNKLNISIYFADRSPACRNTGSAPCPRALRLRNHDDAPDPAAVEQYVSNHGLNAFYDSVDLRKSCCHIRKVEPLNRALEGKQAWITGQRRAQAATRTELAEQEDDTARGMQKFNPLADWTEQDVGLSAPA
jgi:phosphoadenosine phosphosulfate reductase